MYKLRELEKRDLQAINCWRNDSELIAQLDAPYRFINLDVNTDWFDSYMKNRNPAIRCAIARKDTDEILGLISLVSVDFLNQSAELHIMIGDEVNRGKGIGTFAVCAMVYHAFFNMNLHRVELTVLESNLRARHLYEKVGFVKEGLKRKAKYKNGEFADMLLYSMLKEDYSSKAILGEIIHNIPVCWIDFCIEKNEQYQVIKLCDEALSRPVLERENFDELFMKWNSAANFIVAYNSDIIGYSVVYANDFKSNTGYLSMIAVKPNFQNMHIGNSLLMNAEMLAMKHGMKYMKLEVTKTNINAIRFYIKNGYREIQENREFSVYMIKDLSIL